VHPIVVGYDGSADSDRALDWAILVAGQRQCPIRLVAVIDEREDPDWLPDRVENARQHALRQLGPDVEASLALPVTVTKPQKEPATHALLRLASDAQLIVLGARGHGALGGFLIGSVSEHLARHAECPVVVVRAPHDMGARRIVVGFDGSADSQLAVAFGFEMASATKAPLTVVRCWGHVNPGGVGMYLPVRPAMTEKFDAEQQALRDDMREWCDKHPDVDVQLRTVPVPPVRVLTDASAHAALVVVGSRGRDAFAGLLLGSVSQGVLHHAQSPVAIVR